MNNTRKSKSEIKFQQARQRKQDASTASNKYKDVVTWIDDASTFDYVERLQEMERQMMQDQLARLALSAEAKHKELEGKILTLEEAAMLAEKECQSLRDENRKLREDKIKLQQQIDGLNEALRLLGTNNQAA